MKSIEEILAEIHERIEDLYSYRETLRQKSAKDTKEELLLTRGSMAELMYLREWILEICFTRRIEK